MESQRPVSRRRFGVSLRDALISLVVLLLALAALDDITTDNATSFAVEYAALVGCALWFGFVARKAIRSGRPAGPATTPRVRAT